MSSVMYNNLQKATEYIERAMTVFNEIDKVIYSRNVEDMTWKSIPECIGQCIDYRKVFDKFEEFKICYPTPEELESLLCKALGKENS